VYVSDSWSVHEHLESLQEARQLRDTAESKIADLGLRITRNDALNSVVREQLAILRESDSYKLLASLEAKEEEGQRCDSRIDELRNKLDIDEDRIQSLQKDCDQKRQAAMRELTDARNELDRICDRMPVTIPEITAEVRSLLSQLPSQPEEPLDVPSVMRGSA